MDARMEKLAEFNRLTDKYAVNEGVNHTAIDNLLLGRTSKPHGRIPHVYPPGILLGAQGKKIIYLEGKMYDYCAGNFLTLFVPIPVECQIVDVSPENPLLVAGILLDQNRLSNIMMKMDRADQSPVKSDPLNTSGIFSAPINDKMLDAVIRLIKTLYNPVEAAVLGESIIDEIYFYILSNEQGGELKYLLQQRGQIKQISKAVEYVQQNLDKSVSVDDLADIVNMSSSGFHRKFKEVMHMSPLQYAKSIKLNTAKSLITEGKSVSEAGYMVGYNSPAQFSREFKRYFGVVPSAC